MRNERRCPRCHKFITGRPNKRYCSETCRKAAWKAMQDAPNRGAAPIELDITTVAEAVVARSLPRPPAYGDPTEDTIRWAEALTKKWIGALSYGHSEAHVLAVTATCWSAIRPVISEIDRTGFGASDHRARIRRRLERVAIRLTTVEP